MKIVKNINEISRLETVYSKVVIDYLEKYYLEVEDTLRQYGAEPEQEPLMEKYNKFILLESGDSLLSIPDIGITEYDGEIYGSFEFVNKIDIGCINAFMGVILTDNEFAILIFVLKGILDSKEEAFLEEYSIDDSIGGVL